MQSGPIAAFSANAEKNACLRQASTAPGKRRFSERSERLYTPDKARAPANPLHTTFRRASVWRTGPIFSTRCHTPNGTHASDRLPHAKQEGINRLNVRLTAERAFHGIDAMFALKRCSSFLTFHAGISCWHRKRRAFSQIRRPFKRNQPKRSWFPLLKTGARPKRNSHRDVGLCSREDEVLKKKKPTSAKAGAFRFREWCPGESRTRTRLSTTVFETAASLPFRHSGAKSVYVRCFRKRKPKFQSTRKKQRYRPKIVRTGTKAETRRLRSENAEARRSFGSRRRKRRPLGSRGLMRRSIRGEPNHSETR